jgi:hypothetical protein
VVDHVLRVLLWRLLGLIAVPFGVLVIAWLLRGGPGSLLRGSTSSSAVHHVLP